MTPRSVMTPKTTKNNNMPIIEDEATTPDRTNKNKNNNADSPPMMDPDTPLLGSSKRKSSTPPPQTAFKSSSRGRRNNNNNNNVARGVTPEIMTDDGAKKETKPTGAIVTPSENAYSSRSEEEETCGQDARRALFTFPKNSVVTPTPPKKRKETSTETLPSAKRRLIFGKYVDLMPCQPNVTESYKIVRKLTGSIGGNGYCGPIYGELTMGSMQKMINLMMEHTDLNASSRFIDVGSGIGKPNIHVAQFPGVQFSCGVEMEHSRWVLGMTCLKAILDAAMKQQQLLSNKTLSHQEELRGNCVFLHNNITEAKTFDPFTHVYMFSIGFPPTLWLKLSEMFNKSQSEYLICYHAPKDIIHNYEFDVELVAQTGTSMHGSKEGHMGYIYKRRTDITSPVLDACDSLFQPSWKLVQKGLGPLHQEVTREFKDTMGSGRRMRSRR